MNKVILMGRLTRDPEVRYSQGAQGTAICRYSLAVNRSYKREGEPDADFINVVAFGNRGEFAGKYFKKGMMVAVVGELRISSYNDKDGNKRWSTDVVVTEQYFAESRSSYEGRSQGYSGNESDFAPAGSRGYNNSPASQDSDGFMPIDNEIEGDEDLPF
jgi:single-strand DNA-binding protein